jgi:hypothetical protein
MNGVRQHWPNDGEWAGTHILRLNENGQRT